MNGGRRRRRPRGRRSALAASLLGAVLLALLGLVGAAGSASAHSTLERSDPPNGGMVATGRTSLTLWFGEAINGASSSFTVRGSDLSAPPIPTTATLEQDRSVVHLSTPPLDRGTYTITWSVVAVDGHPTRGSILFGAGFRPDGVPASGSGALPDPAQVVLRVADLTGTLVAIGALTVTGRVLGALGTAGVGLRRRVLTIGAVGSAVALVAAIGTPFLTAGAQAGPGASATQWLSAVRDALLVSAWGLLWLGRLGMLALTLVCLVLAVRRAEPSRRVGVLAAHGPGPASSSTSPSPSQPPASPSQRWTAPRRQPTLVAAVALVVASGIDGWSGHASTLPARSPVAALAASVHVVAAGVWAGALLVLVVTVLPVMRVDAATRRTVSPAAWRAFSPMAAISTVALVATGLYESGRHVESLGDLARSVYGTAIVAKLLLVAVALGLAAYNTVLVNRGIAARVGRALRRGPDWRPRRRALSTTVTVETLVLATAVAVAAVMTSVPTAREVRAAQAVTTPHSETIDGLFVTFEAVPVGTRLRLVVRTEAVVRPQPAPPTGVEVGVAAGTTSTLTTVDGHRTVLTQVEPGRWEGETTEPRAADWTAEVVVRRTERPDAAILVPWSSASADTATSVELVTSGVAATLLLGLLALVLVRRRRGITRVRPRTPEGDPSEPLSEPVGSAPTPHRSIEGASSR